MIRRLAIVLGLAIATALSSVPLVSQAGADQGGCHWEARSYFFRGVELTKVVLVCPGAEEPGGGGSVNVVSPEQQEWQLNAYRDCLARATNLGQDPQQFCAGDSGTAPTVTPAMVRSALARIALPPSRLVVQPPGGRTLVNFETNFYTERETFTRAFTLLGRRVTTRISPSAFTWHFEDGESRSTTTPGSPYPDLVVTHSYLQEGGYRPSVDTTYTAVYRVGSGPWQPVPGSVTVAGPDVGLEAVEARPVLTSP